MTLSILSISPNWRLCKLFTYNILRTFVYFWLEMFAQRMMNFPSFRSQFTTASSFVTTIVTMTAPKPYNSARRTQPIELSYYSEASHLARAELSAFWNRRHDATWRDEPTSSANMILLSYATSITAHARWTRFNLFTFRPVRCFQHFTHLSRIIITTSGILRRKWGLKRERN